MSKDDKLATSIKNDINRIREAIPDKDGKRPNSLKDTDMEAVKKYVIEHISELDELVVENIHKVVGFIVKGFNTNVIYNKLVKNDVKKFDSEPFTIDGEIGDGDMVIENQAIITEKKNASMNTKTGETEIVERGKPTTIEVEAREKEAKKSETEVAKSEEKSESKEFEVIRSLENSDKKSEVEVIQSNKSDEEFERLSKQINDLMDESVELFIKKEDSEAYKKIKEAAAIEKQLFINYREKFVTIDDAVNSEQRTAIALGCCLF